MSSYENFVSRLDICSGKEKLNWLRTMDASLLKLELAASRVAISSIHPLKLSMNAAQTGNDKLLQYMIIHMTLVASALAMGYLDRLARQAHP